MKRVLRLLTIFIFLFSLAQTEGYAQKKSRKMIKADNAFNLEQYVKAAELYKKAYKKEKNRFGIPDISYSISKKKRN